MQSGEPGQMMVSPRVELPKVSALLWKAYAAGTVTEEQASELSELIEARKVIPAPHKPVQRHVGSRPRTDASMERRRSWAASGRLPPQVAARFTLAEQAVLAVVAVEVLKDGACKLYIEAIAALAGVTRSTVKRALGQAQGLGFIRIEERRLTAWRNDANVVTIIDPAWSSWLRLRRRGGGVQLGTSTHTKSKKQAETRSIPTIQKVSSASRASARTVWSEKPRRADAG
jgi:hypothetical protein